MDLAISTQLQQLDTFPHLESPITNVSECAKEIRARLAKRQQISSSLKNVWKNYGISVSTKIRLLRALVWPGATYGCEGWTTRKDERTRINAFKMKCLRQILRVSWTAKKTNKWILETTEVDRSLFIPVKQKTVILWPHPETVG